MSRIARKGSARRAEQELRAVASMKTAARKLGRAHQALVDRASVNIGPQVGALVTARNHAVTDLEIAALWFARLEGVIK